MSTLGSKLLKVLGGTVLATVLSSALPACTAIQRGDTMVKIESSDVGPRMGAATQEGNYALYGGTDAKPRLVVHLKAGERLGFDRKDSEIIAVAGGQHMSLPVGSYYWNLRHD